MADQNLFTLKIVTPDRVFYQGEVSMVEFNTTEGEIGVLKGHVPTTVIISPGILTITEAEETKEAALHAGFAEILQNEVVILAEIIEWPEEIDEERAKRARERAEERLRTKTPETDILRAETALQRAMARIHVIKSCIFKGQVQKLASLHTITVKKQGSFAIMYERKILPFYMTYPLPMYYQEEDSIIRDLEYLQQMYPTEAKKYQKLIASILDKLDYEGSMIYDEFPDRWQLYKLSTDILDRIKREESEEGKESPPEKWEWVGDMIQILLFYEIYKRRHNSHRGILKL